MSHLVQLREQIKAIQTTKKITHAVRLVSMSMYSKLEKLNGLNKTYLASITNFFSELLKRENTWQSPIFTPVNLLDSKPLFIIVTTSKGLCGSLNSNLFRFLEQGFSLQEEQTASFIVLGQRGIKFIKEKNWGEIIYTFPELTSHNYISISENILDSILDQSAGFTSITFYSSHLHSFFHQQPRKSVLLPLLRSDLSFSTISQQDSLDLDEDTIFEQPINELLEYTAGSYSYAFIMNIFLQAILAEHAARFLAMDLSTTNAEKFLDKLTLQYNKIRQAVITKEVAELSSGSLVD